MRMPLLRPLLALVAILSAVLGRAGTLTVTTPANNGYLGLSNSVTFNVEGASSKVTVSVAYTAPGATSAVTVTTSVTPDSQGKASGSVPLNFTAGAKEGSYSLVVSATEPNNTYSSTTLSETLDVTAPKFTELSPVTGGSTRGNVRVRGTLLEANLRNWTVAVTYQGNTQTIASGESTAVAATYDATTLPTDGSLTFVASVTDLAGNTATETIALTLDRQRPTVSFVFPTANGTVRGDLNVILDIADASATSVDRTGIDVLVERPDGTYLGRVTLVSLQATSGTVQRWTGRLRASTVRLPSSILIVATAIDRAGNAAATQPITVKYRK